MHWRWEPERTLIKYLLDIDYWETKFCCLHWIFQCLCKKHTCAMKFVHLPWRFFACGCAVLSLLTVLFILTDLSTESMVSRSGFWGYGSQMENMGVTFWKIADRSNKSRLKILNFNAKFQSFKSSIINIEIQYMYLSNVQSANKQ